MPLNTELIPSKIKRAVDFAQNIFNKIKSKKKVKNSAKAFR